MRIGDNMAMDMDSCELHIISSWSDDDEDGLNRNFIFGKK